MGVSCYIVESSDNDSFVRKYFTMMKKLSTVHNLQRLAPYNYKLGDVVLIMSLHCRVRLIMVFTCIHFTVITNCQKCLSHTDVQDFHLGYG